MSRSSRNLKVRNQRGSGSDWVHPFHSVEMRNDCLTNYGLQRIDNAPMFKPFSNGPLPTPTTGIIPTGTAFQAASKTPVGPIATRSPSSPQLGGGKLHKKINNLERYIASGGRTALISTVRRDLNKL